ncbi:MAG: CopD family protein, partial [Cryobacterium sp.]|nr:CopD family protein [Cryobacterium sp.]
MPRLVKIAGPAVLLTVGFISLLVGLALGGGAAASPLADPGAVVRYGLPTAQLLFNISAAATIGTLAMVCFALDDSRKEYAAALDFAAGAAAVWTVASLFTGFLTFLSVYLQPVTFDDRFGQILGSYLTTVPLGQASLVSTVIPAVVTVLCFAVRNHTAMFFITVLAVAGLIPLALQGHAAGSAGHDMAVSSLGLHVVFAAIWLGGLAMIVALKRELEPDRLGPVLSRFSTLALFSFVVVAASGIANAQLRIGTLNNLLTPYGLLVILKVVAICGLGLFGAIQRKYLIAKISSSGTTRSGHFWWFVFAELAVMGFASGIAAALARTRTPIPQELVTTTPAYILTGEPLPPELTPIRFITEWKFDILWMLIVAFAAFFYLAGVRRLHKRGD